MRKILLVDDNSAIAQELEKLLKRRGYGGQIAATMAGAKEVIEKESPLFISSDLDLPDGSSLELLDTPGMLWPKFEDPEVGFRLACTGAVRDEIMDLEELAARLMAYLGEYYPQALAERYKVEREAEDSGYGLLVKAGRKRGFVLRGGEIDTERMARILLDEFRGGKLGRFTLELPEAENV